MSTMRSQVYFLCNVETGAIKIGVSCNVNSRAQSIASQANIVVELLALVEGDRHRERELHRQFAAHRLHGEWFRPAPALLSFIGSLPKPTGPARRYCHSPPVIRSIAALENRALLLRVQGKDATQAETRAQELRGELLRRFGDQEKGHG